MTSATSSRTYFRHLASRGLSVAGVTLVILGTVMFGSSSIANATTNFVPRVVATVSVGDGPRWISSGPRGVYVSNVNANSISVINPKTNTVVATLTAPGLNGPQQSIVEGNFLYVTSNASNSVIIFDTRTNTVSRTVAVGTAPMLIAKCNRELWVANHDAGTLSVINPSTNALATGFTNPVALGHANIQDMSVDGTTLYAANNEDPGYMSIVNCATHTLASSQNGGQNPVAIGVGPRWVGIADSSRPTLFFYDKVSDTTNTEISALGLSGSSVIKVVGDVAYFGGGSVAAVAYTNVASPTVTLQHVFSGNPITLPAGSRVDAMSAFGKYLFVSGRDNSPVNVIDTTTNTLVASLPAGDGSLWMHPHDRFVFVANYESDTVTVIEAQEAPADHLANTGTSNASIGIAGAAVIAGGLFLALGLALRRRSRA